MGCYRLDDPAGPTHWLGDEAHIDVGGRLGGIEFDVSAGPAPPANENEVWCERRYLVPTAPGNLQLWELGTLPTVEIHALLPVADGIERLTVRLQGKDLASQSLDEPADVMPLHPDAELLPGEVAVEWVWANDHQEPAYQAAAVSGVFELRLRSGMPGADGLVIPAGEGAVGGWLEALWRPGEAVRASFTAPCTSSELTEIR
jgi:hypothetical protein